MKELSSEAIVLQEGTVDPQNPLPKGALHGYFRFFQAKGRVFRLGRSELIEVDIWVNRWGTEAQAIVWVESEGLTDLKILSRLMTDQLRAQRHQEVVVNSYSLDAINVGERAAGYRQSVKTSNLLFDGLFVYFASGTSSVQINATGAPDKVYLEDVLQLAELIEGRLQP